MRILIVEDNAGYAEALETAVSMIDGNSVVGRASTGAEALELAATLGDGVDCVLLDLRLPHGTGIEILPELKEALPQARVVMLTSSGKEHDVVQALSRGADGYLLKSASVTEIIAALQSLAEGGTPIDAQVAGYLLGNLRNADRPETSGVLTDREVEILRLLADGLTKKEIASSLHLSYATVDSHVRNVYGKLTARNVAEAISKGYKSGLIRLD